MTRQKSQDRCVECGAPANHRLVCPVHEPDYSDALVDDVDPAAREPARVVLRVVQ
jgi:hypothetical protein